MMTEYRPLPRVRLGVARFHDLEDHVFWMDRNGVCPYCVIGSVPVEKVVILEELEK